MDDKELLRTVQAGQNVTLFGVAYQPVRRDETDLAELLMLLKPLMDPDYCSPFMSAWELDPFASATLSDGQRLDGEQLHERIKAVYDRLTAGEEQPS